MNANLWDDQPRYDQPAPPRPAKITTMPFGRFRNRSIRSLPGWYLAWLGDQEFVERRWPELFLILAAEWNRRMTTGTVRVP